MHKSVVAMSIVCLLALAGCASPDVTQQFALHQQSEDAKGQAGLAGPYPANYQEVAREHFAKHITVQASPFVVTSPTSGIVAYVACFRDELGVIDTLVIRDGKIITSTKLKPLNQTDIKRACGLAAEYQARNAQGNSQGDMRGTLPPDPIRANSFESELANAMRAPSVTLKQLPSSDRTLENLSKIVGQPVLVPAAANANLYSTWKNVSSPLKSMPETLIWKLSVVKSIEPIGGVNSRPGQSNALGKILSASDIKNPTVRIVILASDGNLYQTTESANRIDRVLRLHSDSELDKQLYSAIARSLDGRAFETLAIPELYELDSTAEMIYANRARRSIDSAYYRSKIVISNGRYEPKYDQLVFEAAVAGKKLILKANMDDMKRGPTEESVMFSLGIRKHNMDARLPLDLGSSATRQTPTSRASTPAASPPASRRISSPTCYVGPRGGTYTITSSGRKNYGGC